MADSRAAGERERPRRRSVLVALVPFVLAPLAAVGAAGDAPARGTPDRISVTREREDGPVRAAAIERGLRFLSGSQLESGAVSGRYPVAVTALAGMAILGAGHGYREAPFGAALRKAVRFLLRSATAGYIADGKSRMHGHCYAVLFLSQVYGQVPPEESDEVRRAIAAGLRTIETGQNPRTFGWTYEPVDPQDDEASITICALQALRAANAVGFFVPKGVVDRGVDYVRRCQDPDGSFRYSLAGHDTHTSYALTVAAISVFHAAGLYDAPEIVKGLDYARRCLADEPGEPLRASQEEFRLYGNIYAAQAFYQAGGDIWAAWLPEVRKALLRRQAADGSWNDPYGEEFGTAGSLLILEVPLNYLPIFQR